MCERKRRNVHHHRHRFFSINRELAVKDVYAHSFQISGVFFLRSDLYK